MSRERELLEQCRLYLLANNGNFNLIEEIQAALAEPELEPVATVAYEHAPFSGGDGKNVIEALIDLETLPDGTKLYTHPPRQEPVYLSNGMLTDYLESNIPESWRSEMAVIVLNKLVRFVEQASLKANGLVK